MYRSFTNTTTSRILMSREREKSRGALTYILSAIVTLVISALAIAAVGILLGLSLDGRSNSNSSIAILPSALFVTNTDTRIQINNTLLNPASAPFTVDIHSLQNAIDSRLIQNMMNRQTIPFFIQVENATVMMSSGIFFILANLRLFFRQRCVEQSCFSERDNQLNQLLSGLVVILRDRNGLPIPVNIVSTNSTFGNETTTGNITDGNVLPVANRTFTAIAVRLNGVNITLQLIAPPNSMVNQRGALTSAQMLMQLNHDFNQVSNITQTASSRRVTYVNVTRPGTFPIPPSAANNTAPFEPNSYIVDIEAVQNSPCDNLSVALPDALASFLSGKKILVPLISNAAGPITVFLYNISSVNSLQSITSADITNLTLEEELERLRPREEILRTRINFFSLYTCSANPCPANLTMNPSNRTRMRFFNLFNGTTPDIAIKPFSVNLTRFLNLSGNSTLVVLFDAFYKEPIVGSILNRTVFIRNALLARNLIINEPALENLTFNNLVSPLTSFPGFSVETFEWNGLIPLD